MAVVQPTGSRSTTRSACPAPGPVAFASFTFADDLAGLGAGRAAGARRAGVTGGPWITEFSHGDGPSAVRAVEPGAAQRHPALRRRSAAGGPLPGRGRRGGAPDAGRRAGQGRARARPAGHRRHAAGRPLPARTGWPGAIPTCWSYAVDGLVGRHPGAAGAAHRGNRAVPGAGRHDLARRERRGRHRRPGRAAARLGEGPPRARARRRLARRRRCARCAPRCGCRPPRR